MRDSNIRATYGSIHHVGFAVSQSLHSVEYINHVLSLCHLTHNATGTEYSATPTAISTKYRKYYILTSQTAQNVSGVVLDPFIGHLLWCLAQIATCYKKDLSTEESLNLTTVSLNLSF